MVSKTLAELPTIDLGSENVKPGTSSWTSTCKKVREALEDYGCFVATYDDVSLDLHNKVFNVIEPMFELPMEVKARNTSDLPYHGYFNPGPGLPLLDSFGIEDASILDNTRRFTHVLWPNGNDQFCETVHELAKNAWELERMVTRMVFESYGTEKHLEAHLNSATCLLRIIRYRAPQEDEGDLGVVPHTDKNFLTLLHQNDIDGLEVQTKDGDWISYQYSPNSFVVMAGESLLAWSNDRIYAPVHRVMMKEKHKGRLVMGMFSRSKGIMETPKELVDEEHPLLFKPFDYLGLLNFYTADASRAPAATIKAYCGL